MSSTGDGVKVYEIMSKNPFTITPETKIKEVQLLFTKVSYWAIYIVKFNRLVGVVTRNDLRNRSQRASPSDPISKIMSTKVFRINKNASVNQAISLLTKYRLSSLAVIDKGTLCGVITVGDIKWKYHPTKQTSKIKIGYNTPKPKEKNKGIVEFIMHGISSLVNFISSLFFALLAISFYVLIPAVVYLLIYLVVGAFTHQNALLTQPLDDQWVADFFSSVGAERDASYSYCPTLSSFAKLRFDTMSKHYEISHYGHEADLSSYFGVNYYTQFGEQVHYPANYNPDDFIDDMKVRAPIHWTDLANPTFKYYGYYLADGPTYFVRDYCSVTEVPGPNINIPKFYHDYECSFDIGHTTWFVIEIANNCPE